MSRKKLDDVRVIYDGHECRVVLGPPVHVELHSGALWCNEMPSIDLVEVKSGKSRGLTVDIPAAQLKPGQVLVCGNAEGLRALTEAGVVRHTGEYFQSKKYDATFAVCDLLLDSFDHDYSRPVPELAERERPRLHVVRDRGRDRDR